MFKSQEGIGERGERVPGPPWILGHRGSPRNAPENTMASLVRAIDYGLDGVEYDLQRCMTGEAVLLHDETLDRTTNATGRIALRSLPELFGIDAGGWFHNRFEGEPLPLFDEVLDLPGNQAGARPQHMIELKDPELVGEVARHIRERGQKLSVRIASFYRAVCLEARDLGLPTMLLADFATEEDRAFIRDERITAHGVGPGGWRTEAGGREWKCERWSWSVDEPNDLLEACRAPFNGFNTNEPLRALAIRAMVHLAPNDAGPYPIQVPTLEIMPGVLGTPDRPGGEWSGRWKLMAKVRNPFPFRVRAIADVWVRGGAFEVEGLKETFDLPVGGEMELPFEITGGSWSPGSDPLLAVAFRWQTGPGRPEEGLVLDAPLHRIRTIRATTETQRLPMLIEGLRAKPASMTVRREGNRLMLAVENPGGLEHPKVLVRLGAQQFRGNRGLALSLPVDFDQKTLGLAFSCGFEGEMPPTDEGRVPLQIRRWAGGIPGGLEAGVPGCLLPR
ncbi:MAG: glycerophosphoryl diester phosphodiesterase [Planctomycetota bacterium]|jgi:glycerophosphoryl diester phosphodiesterase